MFLGLLKRSVFGLFVVFLLFQSTIVMAQTPGTLFWSYTTGGAVHSPPAMSADLGVVYVGSFDGHLYALDYVTGDMEWSFDTGGVIVAAPTVASDGTIIVGSNAGFLYALNPDGTLAWKFQTGHLILSSVAIGADGTVYLTSQKLYAINPADQDPGGGGTAIWDFDSKVFDTCSPSVDPTHSAIYIGSNDGTIFAINLDGTEKWRYAKASATNCSAAIGADGTVYIGDSKGRLYAFSAELPVGPLGPPIKHAPKWTYTTGEEINGSPAIAADGTIYFGCDDGYVYGLFPDGSLKYKSSSFAPFNSSPCIAGDGTVYIGCDDAKLYAFNANLGVRWTYTTGGSIISGPLVGPRTPGMPDGDDIVFVGSNDKSVYAIYSDTECLADSSWPMFGHEWFRTSRFGTFGDGSGCYILPPCEVEDVFVLCTGLNLISLPIENSGIDTADELLASICGAGESNAVWRLLHDPPRFESWTILDPGTGWPVWTGMPFWIGVSSPGCDWNLCGDMPSGIVYDLVVGINLVSRPFYTETVTTASQLLAGIPGCLGVWRWSAEVDCSEPSGFDGFFPISPSFDDFPLMKGHAYWITTETAGPWAPPEP